METNFQEDKDYKDAVNLLEVIEDTVQYFCDENKVSGEKVWHMINSLSAVSYTHLTLPTKRIV